ncbi:MAG: peptidoglycan-binding domain-containing protein, partial [Rivularia sp. (in: cyanobacteria)]
MVLKKGSKGSDVTKLQQRLKNLGYYSSAIDGDFGPKTEAAVIAYQKNNYLVADGVVGDETQASIQQKNWILKRPILRQGAKGKDVELLQNIL